MENGGPVWLAALVTLLLAALAVVSYQPPPALPADAPPDRFSGYRAQETLRFLLGDETPHPVGSAANRAVRDRLLQHLESLGLKPSIQRTVGCSGKYPICANVENVLAELEDLYFQHGLRHVVFRDPIFTTRKDRVHAICEGIVERGMTELEWQCETAVKVLDRPLLEKMALAGCKHVSLGVESGNDEIQRKHLKPGAPPEAEFKTDATSVSAVEHCNKHGLWGG